MCDSWEIVLAIVGWAGFKLVIAATCIGRESDVLPWMASRVQRLCRSADSRFVFPFRPFALLEFFWSFPGEALADRHPSA